MDSKKTEEFYEVVSAIVKFIEHTDRPGAVSKKEINQDENSK